MLSHPETERLPSPGTRYDMYRSPKLVCTAPPLTPYEPPSSVLYTQCFPFSAGQYNGAASTSWFSNPWVPMQGVGVPGGFGQAEGGAGVGVEVGLPSSSCVRRQLLPKVHRPCRKKQHTIVTNLRYCGGCDQASGLRAVRDPSNPLSVPDPPNK